MSQTIKNTINKTIFVSFWAKMQAQKKIKSDLSLNENADLFMAIISMLYDDINPTNYKDIKILIHELSKGDVAGVINNGDTINARGLIVRVINRTPSLSSEFKAYASRSMTKKHLDSLPKKDRTTITFIFEGYDTKESDKSIDAVSLKPVSFPQARERITSSNLVSNDSISQFVGGVPEWARKELDDAALVHSKTLSKQDSVFLKAREDREKNWHHIDDDPELRDEFLRVAPRDRVIDYIKHKDSLRY